MKCYLCKTPLAFYLEKNGYFLYTCPHCELTQTDLKQKYEDFVKDFYGKGYFTGDPSRTAYVSYEKDKPFIAKNMARFLQEVLLYKKSGKLLEAGCAYGYFLELAIIKGFDAYGFDPSAHAVGVAKKLIGKGRVKLATIGEVTYPKKSFDVIVLFDVFEHLSDPANDISRLKSFLKDDGIMMIATGDTKSTMARIMGRRWTFYNPPQHLFFFNKKTLTTLLGNIGMIPVHWFNIGKWLSLEYVLHLAATAAESKVGNVLYHWAKKSPIGRLPLYLPARDNMIVIAKKQI